jgi:predicted RNase H-like HicB family nuclease
MRLTIRVEKKSAACWIAEVIELAWVVAHGGTREEAICRAEVSAVEEIAERVARGELTPSALQLSFSISGSTEFRPLARAARPYVS